MAQETKTVRRPGGALDGFTEETYASSRSVLETTRSGTRKGLQQYFSPAAVALFVQSVVNPNQQLAVLDPTAGDGGLLWPHQKRFGIELHEPTLRSASRVLVNPDDPRYSVLATAFAEEHDGKYGERPFRSGEPVYADQSYNAIRGDLQHVYPLLRTSGTRFGAIVANPPFGLTWQVKSLNDGQPASSTLLTWHICQHLRAPGANGAFICGTARLEREILSDTKAMKAIYCIVDMPEMFAGVDLPCSIAFWADPDCRCSKDSYIRLAVRSLADLSPHTGAVLAARQQAFRGLAERDCFEETINPSESFPLIQVEYKRRTAVRVKNATYDVQLTGDRIEVHLSPLALAAMDKQRTFATLHPFLQSLHHQRANYFALNTRDWRRLLRAVDSDLITIRPADRERIEAIVTKAAAVACPIYPIEPQQRLAYIQDLERLLCTKDDPERGYVAGVSYPVEVSTEIDSRQRTETKIEAGQIKTLTFRADYKVLRIMVGEENPQRFSETKEDIDYLLDHFDIPDPGDVSTRYPEEIERWRGIIRSVQCKRLTPGTEPRPFQIEDVARLLFKGSAVLSWEQGGGKTFGSMLAVACFEEARQSDGNALFVVPQDLIPQWQAEARKFFGRSLVHIGSRSQARKVCRGIKAGTIAPQWYITHYEALAINDIRINSITVLADIRNGRFVRTARSVRSIRGRVAMEPEPVIQRAIPVETEDGEKTCRQVVATSEDLCPRCHQTEASGEWDGRHCRRCGETRALLVVKPMAHELATAFRKGCIVVDEGTKIKADDSLTSLAVRGLRARHRILLTGTPQKNYVHDLFHLLCWALGPASVRFPFAYGAEGKSKFEADFCVVERLVGGKRRKVLPEVTNLSVLWRLLSGAIVRRRKEDMGEPIVERTFMPITVPFGTRQRAQYLEWLNGFSRWYAQSHPDLTSEGIEKQAAVLGQLVKLEYATTLPCADPDAGYWHVGVSDWTPKMLKVLEIAGAHAASGEKVLVGSDLMLTGKFVADHLVEKGVKASHILCEAGQTLNPRDRCGKDRRVHQGRHPGAVRQRPEHRARAQPGLRLGGDPGRPALGLRLA